MRLYVLSILILAGSVLPALGQVAAPSLIPAAPGLSDPIFFREPTFVPVNPAVMGWRKYSVAGASIGRDEMIRLPVSTASALYIRFEDTAVGVQWVGNQYAFAAQNFNMVGEGEDYNFKDEGTALAAAARWWNWLSLGVGLYGDKHEEDSVATEVSGSKVGASGRFGDSWYVGMGIGQEEVKRAYINNPDENWSGDRPSTVFGVGYLNEGEWRLHVELWVQGFGEAGEKDNQVIKSKDVSGLVVEGAHGPWVAGLTVNHLNEVTASSQETIWNSTGNVFTIGLVPASGLALLFHYGWSESEVDSGQAAGPIKIIATSRSLSAVWIF